MKQGLWLCILALCSCVSCQPVKESGGTPTLTAKVAKQAIVAFIEAHPDVFVSPGRAETLEGIQKVEVTSIATGGVAIGLFQVDLDKKSYQLRHAYGKPGSGWWEEWLWKGGLELRSGTWELTEPEFTKLWGE